MSYCRLAWQSLPCYTVVAQLGFKRRAYCRAKVEFNMINLVLHGSSTTFETNLSTDDIFREGKLLDRQPFWFGRIKLSTLPVGGVFQCVWYWTIRPRANYVTSLMTFYLRLGRLLRRFWRLTERTLECNKCSVEYVQHFCYVLRFAPSLRFTLWFVHNDIWSSKEFSGNQHPQNMQKKFFEYKSTVIVTQQSAISFFKMDEKFHPTIWFLKRKLHSITGCETGSETTAPLLMRSEKPRFHSGSSLTFIVHVIEEKRLASKCLPWPRNVYTFTDLDQIKRRI